MVRASDTDGRTWGPLRTLYSESSPGGPHVTLSNPAPVYVNGSALLIFCRDNLEAPHRCGRHSQQAVRLTPRPSRAPTAPRAAPSARASPQDRCGPGAGPVCSRSIPLCSCGRQVLTMRALDAGATAWSVPTKMTTQSGVSLSGLSWVATGPPSAMLAPSGRVVVPFNWNRFARHEDDYEARSGAGTTWGALLSDDGGGTWRASRVGQDRTPRLSDRNPKRPACPPHACFVYPLRTLALGCVRGDGGGWGEGARATGGRVGRACAFSSPQASRTGIEGGNEGQIALAPDGRLLANLRVQFPDDVTVRGARLLASSTDEGETWRLQPAQLLHDGRAAGSQHAQLRAARPAGESEPGRPSPVPWTPQLRVGDSRSGGSNCEGSMVSMPGARQPRLEGPSSLSEPRAPSACRTHHQKAQRPPLRNPVRAAA